jgi:hypothetical protein
MDTPPPYKGHALSFLLRKTYTIYMLLVGGPRGILSCTQQPFHIESKVEFIIG